MSEKDIREAAAAAKPVKLPPNMIPMNKTVRDRLGYLSGRIRSAADARPNLNPDYLIKGWLTSGATSVIYGPSNVGKTFLALDMAQAVAAGRDWFGCRTHQRYVLYAAAEGGQAFENRLAAIPGACFDWIPHPFDMHASSLDAEALAHAYNQANPYGQPGLIIIDTLARVMAAGDENSSVDMGLLIRNIDTLARMTRAHVMLIHHTGKDTTLGARGHSSLRAAIDTEIELARDDDSGVISIMARKQRDIGVGRELHYTLAEVHLGVDPDGDPVTTCTVAEAAAPEPETKDRRAPLNGTDEVAYQALQEAIREHGVIRSGQDYPDCRIVHYDQWRDACIRHGLFSADEGASGRKRFARAKDRLVEKHYVRAYQDHWWVC